VSQRVGAAPVQRAGIPPVAWVLSGGFAVALFALAAIEISRRGHAQFFHDGDSNFYLLTARSLLGNGSLFGGREAAEVPYRYGRIGFPLVAWLFGLGRPALIGWSMIIVYLGSMAAIPGIAATLLAEYEVPPARAVFVLLTPGLLLTTGLVYAEALQIALILLACLFEARRQRRAALVTLAFAILVKETSVLALLPWAWTAWKRRDARQIASCVAVLIPYAFWSLWVRLRIGQFPFLARTPSRAGAMALPGVAIRDALSAHFPNHTVTIAMTASTFALGVVASWAARRCWIAPITAAFTALIACYGPSTLYYLLENLRLLSVPTVLAVLCLVVATSPREQSRARGPRLQRTVPSSGARNCPV
jgi:hypothetical protein